MKKSLFWAIITTLTFLLCSSCSDGSVIHYTTNDGEKIEINRASFDAIIISHRYVDGVGHIKFLNKLTKISVRAFLSSNRLTNITIPNSVTEIGNYAFSGCTSLTSVTIPNSVTSIGDSAFRYCPSLTRVDISDLSAWCKISFGNGLANPFCNGAKLYLNGSELTDITIPSDITEIKSCTFYGCTSLTSVTIPNSVTSIGGSAFRNCTSLTSVTIGNSVTSIGDDAFYGCSSLARVDISDLSAWCKISFGGSSANPLCNGARLYLNGSELTDITIPSDITKIKRYAFQNCTSLTSVTIPDSVTVIGGSAFSDCTLLTSVTIPDSVTVIGGSAFSDCTLLTSITIPNSVTSIGDDAFRGCAGELILNCSCLGLYGGQFTKVVIGDSITEIYCFSSSEFLKELVVKNANAKVYRSAFDKCNNLSSIMIGKVSVEKVWSEYDGMSYKRKYDFSDSDDLKQYLKWMSMSSLKCPDNDYIHIVLDDVGEPSTLYSRNGEYKVFEWGVKYNNEEVLLKVVDKKFYDKLGLVMIYYLCMSKEGKLNFSTSEETLVFTSDLL